MNDIGLKRTDTGLVFMGQKVLIALSLAANKAYFCAFGYACFSFCTAKLICGYSLV